MCLRVCACVSARARLRARLTAHRHRDSPFDVLRISPRFPYRGLRTRITSHNKAERKFERTRNVRSSSPGLNCGTLHIGSTKSSRTCVVSSALPQCPLQKWTRPTGRCVTRIAIQDLAKRRRHIVSWRMRVRGGHLFQILTWLSPSSPSNVLSRCLFP